MANKVKCVCNQRYENLKLRKEIAKFRMLFPFLLLLLESEWAIPIKCSSDYIDDYHDTSRYDERGCEIFCLTIKKYKSLLLIFALL